MTWIDDDPYSPWLIGAGDPYTQSYDDLAYRMRLEFGLSVNEIRRHALVTGLPEIGRVLSWEVTILEPQWT